MISWLFTPVRRAFLALTLAQRRERQIMISEMTQMRDMVPILMKPRNGEQWTQEDKEKIRGNLRGLSRLSPYLLPLVMPGGFVAWPLLAWWLDRRRQRREKRPVEEQEEHTR